MKENNLFIMSRQSLVESNDKFPPHPLDFNNNNMEQQHKDVEQNTSASITKVNNKEEVVEVSVVIAEDSGRERLKKHRVEVGGRIWIPEIWGQEEFLMDWIDCTTAFHAHLVPTKIITAQEALVQEGRKVY
ncbi:unnamed protein product [Lupinus luteus]|uniref:Protein BIC1 n=1 Tax=Lupinus luteus TaxID=3873 RepID=A0AAV1XYW5_LUPLU